MTGPVGYAPPPAGPRKAAGGRVNDSLAGAALAAAGAIGLGCTLLPLIKFRFDGDQLLGVMDDISLSDADLLAASSGTISFGFYDFLSSTLLVSAAIPLALILALFAGGVLLAGYSAKSLLALSGLSSGIALLLTIFLAIRPMGSIGGSIDGWSADSIDASLVGWSFGAGLYATVSMLVIAACLAVWGCLRRA